MVNRVRLVRVEVRTGSLNVSKSLAKVRTNWNSTISGGVPSEITRSAGTAAKYGTAIMFSGSSQLRQ